MIMENHMEEETWKGNGNWELLSTLARSMGTLNDLSRRLPSPSLRCNSWGSELVQESSLNMLLSVSSFCWFGLVSCVLGIV